MKKTYLLFLFVAVFIVIGCAKPVHKDWAAFRGSKGDGTVTMGLSWNPQTEILEHSFASALEIATEKCRSWGYESAEAFGAIVENCTQMTYTNWGPICNQMRAEAMFQCKDLTEGANSAKSTTANKK